MSDLESSAAQALARLCGQPVNKWTLTDVKTARPRVTALAADAIKDTDIKNVSTMRDFFSKNLAIKEAFLSKGRDDANAREAPVLREKVDELTARCQTLADAFDEFKKGQATPKPAAQVPPASDRAAQNEAQAALRILEERAEAEREAQLHLDASVLPSKARALLNKDTGASTADMLIAARVIGVAVCLLYHQPSFTLRELSPKPFAVATLEHARPRLEEWLRGGGEALVRRLRAYTNPTRRTMAFPLPVMFGDIAPPETMDDDTRLTLWTDFGYIAMVMHYAELEMRGDVIDWAGVEKWARSPEDYRLLNYMSSFATKATAASASRQSNSKGGSASGSGSGHTEKRCFRCNAFGHLERNCPQGGPTQDGRTDGHKPAAGKKNRRRRP